MSYFDDASLVMIPSGYKDQKVYSVKPIDGTGDLTFSRGSDIEATRVNANGYIEKAKVNVLTYSNDFSNAAWTKTRSSLVGGQAGYDGSNDAWAYVDTTDNSTHLMVQAVTLGAQVATFSVYAKAAAVDFLVFRFEGATGVDYAYFNLSNGTLGTIDADYIDAKITSVGGGWYRCEATRLLGASGNQAIILSAEADNDPTYAGAGTTALYIQDAQLNYGLVAQEYQETTTTSVVTGITNDMPRLDYSGGASCPSLLLEGERQNLVTHSEYISGLSRSGVSITSNETTSPEGVINASKVAYVSGAAYIVGGSSLTTGTDYTFSGFFKADESNYIVVNQAGAGATNAFYNLTDGTHSGASGITTDMIDYGNGWYRIIYTDNLLYDSIRIYMSGNGSYGNYPPAGEGFFAWGFQTEQANYPTSLIPTYGTSATRTADACSKTGISSLIGQASGSVVADLDLSVASGFEHLFNIYDSTNTESILVYLRNTNRIRFAATGASNYDDVEISSGRHKVAVVWDGSNISYFRDGSKLITRTGFAKTLTFSDFYLGNRTDVNENPDTAHQVLFFTSALSDADAITLTTL